MVKYWVIAAFAIGFSAGCLGGVEGENYCEAICAKQMQCETGYHMLTCMNQCTQRVRGRYDRLRSDYADNVISCAQTKPCPMINIGGLSRLSVESMCAEEAAALLSPSGTATNACDQYEATYTRCALNKNKPFDKAACLLRYKIVTDSVLDGVIKCFDLATPCDKVEACANSAL